MHAFPSIQLGQAAINFRVNGFFVFLKPNLALALHFQGVEQHIFHAIEHAAMQPLPYQRLDLWTFDFNGHA